MGDIVPQFHITDAPLMLSQSGYHCVYPKMDGNSYGGTKTTNTSISGNILPSTCHSLGYADSKSLTVCLQLLLSLGRQLRVCNLSQPAWLSLRVSLIEPFPGQLSDAYF